MAQHEIYKSGGHPNLIPSGLNLGGPLMMRMKDSLLFFYRLKLRNDTEFRVNYLRTDFVNMTLIGRLNLHDLHLIGAYDRSPTYKDPSVLFYAPTFGQVEFLLKNVQYNMEGRLRLIMNRLTIELIISELLVEDILMTYQSKDNTEEPVRLPKANMEQFLHKLKIDLDKWLKDYFNNYLSHKKFVESQNVPLQRSEKDKAVKLNEYADSAVNLLKRRIREVGASSVRLPQFTIFANQYMQIKLKDGILRGLDSMYRRSVATGRRDNKLRKVDLIVGFSNLKVMYTYQAILSSEVKTLSGIMVLTADELTAHLGITLLKEPETVDLTFDFMHQLKPESLTIEGPANRMIANFKHLLEHHIIALMSNTLLHNIKMLSTLPRCVPSFFGQADRSNTSASDLENNQSHENNLMDVISNENDTGEYANKEEKSNEKQKTKYKKRSLSKEIEKYTTESSYEESIVLESTEELGA
ncbi:uncharacterized protein LOC110386240 [Bombyx mori]